MLAQQDQDQAENNSHIWSHFTETGQDKMRQPFQYYLVIFSFELTVSGISFFLDFMGVNKHREANSLWRSDFVKAVLPVAI